MQPVSPMRCPPPGTVAAAPELQVAARTAVATSRVTSTCLFRDCSTNSLHHRSTKINNRSRSINKAAALPPCNRQPLLHPTVHTAIVWCQHLQLRAPMWAILEQSRRCWLCNIVTHIATCNIATALAAATRHLLFIITYLLSRWSLYPWCCPCNSNIHNSNSMICICNILWRRRRIANHCCTPRAYHRRHSRRLCSPTSRRWCNHHHYHHHRWCLHKALGAHFPAGLLPLPPCRVPTAFRASNPRLQRRSVLTSG